MLCYVGFCLMDEIGLTPNGEVRIKFETLRSLDPETLEIDNRAPPVQYPMQQMEHYQQINAAVQLQQQQLQHQHQIQMQLQMQQQQAIKQHQQQQQQNQNHQAAHQQHMQQHQIQQIQTQSQLVNANIVKIEPGIVIKQEQEMVIKEEPRSPHNNHQNQTQPQLIHNQQMPSPHQQQTQPTQPQQPQHQQHQQQPKNEVDLSVVKQEHPRAKPEKKSKSKKNNNFHVETNHMGEFIFLIIRLHIVSCIL